MLSAISMRIAGFVLLMLSLVHLHGQDAERVITSIDSFPPFVKTATMKEYLPMVSDMGDTALLERSSRYVEVSPTGAWFVRIETYADGDVSNDTMIYDASRRTRTIRRSNNFEPSTTTIAYNPDGTVNSVFFDADMRDDIKDQYEYDAKGRLIRHTQILPDQQRIEEHVYDRQSRLVQTDVAAGSVTGKDLTTEFRVRHFYNEKNLRVMSVEQFLDIQGEVRITDTVWMEYDSLSRMVYRKESRQNGINAMEYVFKYDSNNRLIEKRYTYDNRETGDKGFVNYRWEYDTAGFCSLSSEESNTYGVALTWRTTYNEKGLPVQCIYSTESEVWLFKWEYEYKK